MADRLIKAETLTDIADAIRERTETTATINPRDFASHIRTLEGEKTEPYDEAVTVDDGATVVFDEDYTEGYKEGEVAGYNNGVEAGRKAEYDEFWDMFQENGSRTDYRYAFAYTQWDDANFNPKYPIKIVGTATYTFVGTTFEWKDKVLEVDLSEATSLQWTFRNNQFYHLGKCDLSSAASSNGTFAVCNNLQSIAEIVSNENLTWNNDFQYDSNLETVIFSGVIAKSGLNFQWSTKLSKASITSIINCLSTTTSGLTVTLSKDAVNKAFETSEGANDGRTSTEWTSLIGTRSNWTISLL